MFVQGVISAIRTAMWAGLLLVILVYMAGVLARQPIGEGAEDEA